MILLDDDLDRADTESSSPIVDAIIDRGATAGLTIADEIRRTLLNRLRLAHLTNPASFLADARKVLIEYEPLLARTMSDAWLAAWLAAGDKILQKTPAPAIPPVPPRLPPVLLPTSPDEPDPVVTFPQIDEAARNLAKRRVMLRYDFDKLSADAKQTGFTVAKVTTETALEKIQQALVEDVKMGGTLREFKAKIGAAVSEDGALSPGAVENVYRTNIGQAYAEGQRKILAHPMVGNAFPYVLWNYVHDTRVRDDHKQFGTLGLNGTNVYRADDPLIKLLWPPFYFKCRCSVVPLNVADAARRGVKEAEKWEQSGMPPSVPEWVAWPSPLPDHF